MTFSHDTFLVTTTPANPLQGLASLCADFSMYHPLAGDPSPKDVVGVTISPTPTAPHLATHRTQGRRDVVGASIDVKWVRWCMSLAAVSPVGLWKKSFDHYSKGHNKLVAKHHCTCRLFRMLSVSRESGCVPLERRF